MLVQFKHIIVIVLFTTFTACSFGINEKLDIEVAESLITNYEKTGLIDTIALTNIGTQKLLVNTITDGYIVTCSQDVD